MTTKTHEIISLIKDIFSENELDELYKYIECNNMAFKYILKKIFL